MYSGQLICVYYQYLGENSSFLFGHKIFHAITQLWVKLQQWKPVLSDFVFLILMHLIKQLSLRVYINKKTSLMCENSVFCSPELSFSLQESYCLQ